MKKTVATFLIGLAGVSASANHSPAYGDKFNTPARHDDTLCEPVSERWLDNAWESLGWKHNWFVGASCGGAMFIGSPLGCEDDFGRTKPLIRANFGRWITPKFATRVQYEGWRFKAADMVTSGYQSWHLDIMWNPLGIASSVKFPRLDISPYIGAGFVHNSRQHNFPFAFSYGVSGRLRLSHDWSLTMELGGTTTFKDFDGYGDSRELGDHLIGLSVGASWNIGGRGFRRVADSRPYREQSAKLCVISRALADRNRQLASDHKADSATIAELKKILAIEGLLDRYGYLFNRGFSAVGDTVSTINSKKSGFPKNDYSGLNSLMARLRAAGIERGDDKDLASELEGAKTDRSLIIPEPVLVEKVDTCGQEGTDSIVGDVDSDIWARYLAAMAKGDTPLGPPVFFFFRLGTAQLTDPSQLVNIDEIARLAIDYGLTIKVIGAADAATGTEAINTALSHSRAEFIAAHLQAKGVATDHLILESKGGIATYSTNESNRHSSIQLLIQ
ncbi:MAG: OmpA family protein [Bacteroidales bacterium]|nr:OmpA family protein [Bacteroidales bacterium]